MSRIVGKDFFSFKKEGEIIFAKIKKINNKSHINESLLRVSKENKWTIMRDYIAKKYIKNILNEINQNKIEVDSRNDRIIDYWESFIEDFIETDYLNETVENSELMIILNKKKKLFIEVLKNKDNRYLLLTDRDLSPEKLSYNELSLKKAYETMINQMKNHNEEKSKKIGVVNPGQGLFLEYLLSEVKSVKQVDLIGFTSLLLDNLKKKYGDIIFSKLEFNEEFISGDMLGQYDYLIMPNTAHHFENLKNVVSLLNLTLKKAGEFHIIDFQKMDSMSTLIAIFFQEKHLYARNKIRDEFFYKSQYIKKIADYLYIDPNGSYIDNNETVFHVCFKNKGDYKNEVENIAEKYNIPKRSIVVSNGNNIEVNVLKNQFDTKQIIYQESNSEILEEEDVNFEKLRNIWEENLNFEGEINKTSNYFQLGGDSMSATRLARSISNELNYEISLSEIFTNSVFQDMLTLVEEKISIDDIDKTIVEGEI